MLFANDFFIPRGDLMAGYSYFDYDQMTLLGIEVASGRLPDTPEASALSPSKVRNSMRKLMSFSLVFLLFCPMASADIVGMWLFDEGMNDVIVDWSRRGHDGKLHGDFQWVAGKFGKAISLKDTGYMELEHHEDLSFSDAYTIMIWANIEEIVPQEWVGMPRKEGEYVLLMHNGTEIEMAMGVNTGDTWQGPVPPLGTGIPTAYGEWHHYASTYDGDVCRVYVDGEEAGSQQVGGPLNKTDAVVRISNSCCGGRFMVGMIDEFIMADECFTQDRIRDFMWKGASIARKLAIAWGAIKR